MKLIDADVLIEAIRSHYENVYCEDSVLNNFYRLAHEHVIDVVNIQKTAFDVKKVVEQLEEATVSGMGGVGFNKNVYEIIDIVKRGGADLGYNPYQE